MNDSNLFPTENFSLIKALSFSRNRPESRREDGTSSEFQMGANTLFQLNNRKKKCSSLLTFFTFLTHFYL